MWNLDDTIAALASAPGRGVRSLIRISGPDSITVVDSCFRPDEMSVQFPDAIPHRVSGEWRSAGDQPAIPCSVQLWKTQRSFTCQPMAEIHFPGSPPLVEIILEDCFRLGIRPARRGEFTLRAFVAGRIDLTEAEAVLGVIDADDADELKAALHQLAGGVSESVHRMREDLLLLLADLEAGLDFVDEDIEFISRDDVLLRLNNVIEQLAQLGEQATERRVANERPVVAIAGLPNAGKSTLLNALTKRDSAIVSPTAGTTRDLVREAAVIGGIDCELVDTAGWETARDGIESVAQSRREQAIGQADLILWCIAADATEHDREQSRSLQQSVAAEHASRMIVIQTKSELADVTRGDSVLNLSAVVGTGLEQLAEQIHDRLQSSVRSDRGLIGTTAVRCAESLRSADASLRRTLSDAECGLGDELISVGLRDALDQLGRVLGLVYTDDILDRIFSRFCIGK